MAQDNKPSLFESLIGGVIRFCLERKIIVFLLLGFTIVWGLMVAPFDWNISGLPRDPVPVDAIPDIGENQQIVFTKWMGRSPQDVEDQITYPLTVSLLGVPGVKTVRSYSMFGFSTIYVIFEDDVEFYWSRSRVLEKLSSLPANTLPVGIAPSLGPDATALGQVYWYTIEGRDEKGQPTGGWDLGELRSVQDWYVRYALLSAKGVSEVASIGGHVKEYQIDVDPDAMRAFGVKLSDVAMAIKMSNKDVGARSIEINRVEYLIRGRGFIRSIEDIENAVIKVNDGVPVYVNQIAKVVTGPALRRGALDKAGAEAVGGVVVARYGENPLQAIKNIKKKIAEISAGLPEKVLSDGRKSKLAIVPFYDRSNLIHETLGTLKTSLMDEILVTIIVVLVMVFHVRSSILIAGLLPLSVLMCFIAMKIFRVDANVVALSGIAIAIGTMVDMGIVVCENIIKRLNEANEAGDTTSQLDIIYQACVEVAGAVITAVATTVVSFLPVFTMEAAEGKLFKPLAFTKTFALMSSIIVALTVLPAIAHLLLGYKKSSDRRQRLSNLKSYVPHALVLAGCLTWITVSCWAGIAIMMIGLSRLIDKKLSVKAQKTYSRTVIAALVFAVTWVLATGWMPLGPEKGDILNFIFVSMIIGGLLGVLLIFQHFYQPMLRCFLCHKGLFLCFPSMIILWGLLSWLGFVQLFGWMPNGLLALKPARIMADKFPGLGKEFMPPLDEGAYLFMPTTMPHASIGEVQEVIRLQDIAIAAIPEVASAVGKLGRAESPLDPAPVSMIETIVNYRSEYIVDENGNRRRFKFDDQGSDFCQSLDGKVQVAPDGKAYKISGKFSRDENGHLVPDPKGKAFRQWRLPLDSDLNPNRKSWAGIQKPDDIWDEIVRVAKVPGTTSAPKLQPIAARIVMLQSGMRAPMGVKVKGPSLEAIEAASLEIEKFLKQVDKVEPAAVIADRVVGKPYLEIDINRLAIARYGIKLQAVQDVIEIAVGGKRITMTIEGRERYPVRVRYQRERRDSIEALKRILVEAPDGKQIPMELLAKINYVRGPQAIKSEDTFLIAYVLFDKKAGYAEVDVVEAANAYLKEKIASGELKLAEGVSFVFSGSYENQVRSEKRLMVVLPLALFVIFMILYLEFKAVSSTLLVFSGILVAWSGGFIMIWLYAQPWFANFSVLGTNMRELFQMHPIDLSVAIWVGFLALFGIATDDGVIMGTYLTQAMDEKKPSTVEAIRETLLIAAQRRIRPCLMTAGTTILALIPVLTSTGRGADIMVPMAIPSFGGMLVVLTTVFVVPVLYCMVKEAELKWSQA